MPAGRPRTNDALYREIHSRIEDGEDRNSVIADVAKRHRKTIRSLNSQYSVWRNSQLPDHQPPRALRAVPLTAIIEVHGELETILAQAESQLARVERQLSDLEDDREALAAHVKSVKQAIQTATGNSGQSSS